MPEPNNIVCIRVHSHEIFIKAATISHLYIGMRGFVIPIIDAIWVQNVFISIHGLEIPTATGRLLKMCISL